MSTTQPFISSARPETSVVVKISPRKRIDWREHFLGFLFLVPSLLLFILFLFYPLMKTIYLSFHLTNPRGKVAAYVGFDNFKELLYSEKFWLSLKVTGLFTLYTVPVGIFIALLLAALSHSRLKGMKGFQFIFSLPLAVSVGTGSVLWMLLFHPSVGVLNYFRSLLGLVPVAWLTDPAWALLSISLMTVWMNLGYQFMVLLSGLQSISSDIYDSIKIDGAGPLRAFVEIIIPLLSPTLFFVTIVSVVGALQSFGQMHILTKGGPMDTTNVAVYSIYKDAFVSFQFGTASAQALILFLLILLMTLIQFVFVEKKVHYQ